MLTYVSSDIDFLSRGGKNYFSCAHKYKFSFMRTCVLVKALCTDK